VTASNTSYVTGGLGLSVSNSGNIAVGNMGLAMGTKVGNVACHELEVRNAAGVQVAQLESTGVLSGLALNVSSDAVVGGNLSSGNITSSGYILGTSWLSVSGIPSSPASNTIYCANLNASSHVLCGSVIQSAPAAGTVLRQFMFTASDIGFTSMVTTTGNVTLGTKSYTPVSTSSYLNIHFGEVGNLTQGSGNDGYYYLKLNVDGAAIGEVLLLYQGTRHYGTNLNAVACRYTNSSTTAKSITVTAHMTGGDDPLKLGPYSSTLLTLTEVAR
jgi:hypothetical protein